ncbi:MAG: hypothetical protein ABIR57_10050 [Aeromicrobium sp.]
MWTTIPGRTQGFADKSDNDGPTRRLERVEFAVRENRYAADPEPTRSISSSRCLKPFYLITTAGVAAARGTETGSVKVRFIRSQGRRFR